ncbi:hypothetical protein [Kingella kingae]|uniref:hypothetical protein n=2 Tax=Kingella kingae TaxID=504 RepID=UPI0025508BC6|nr:hypothetical protein [Kingella kingae]MDK4545142.1 hypothetical protein [Kingella kingae]MDK4614672.1 hypothetical protein [Kingella kingae]MDK4617005.1 hypothetical protein [Kingella kingae]MDK4620925.1 hypothetical protein [Kingella kingae]MDK4629434.1 hypothetical protein [Kingella kingae]
MSNKKLSFFQTQIKFSRKGTDSAKAITSMTNASPPVMTTDEVLKDGDVVHITSNNEQVRGFYMVKVKSSGSYELVGQDFTQVGAITNAKLVKAQTHAFCMATSLDVEPATISFSDVTTNCDDYPQEEGELEAGSASGNAYWNPENPTSNMLEEMMFSQEELFFQFKPKETNVLTGFRANVESWKMAGQTKEKWTADFGLKLKSRPMRVTLTA